MKRTIIKYGLLSGAMAAVLMISTVLISMKMGLDAGALLGYIMLVISFMVIWFAMLSYKKSMGGARLSFGTCIKIGLAISVISSLFYVGAWLIAYYYMIPDFWGQYAKHAADIMRRDHKPESAITAMYAEYMKYKEWYKNPLINAAFTFTEPFPVGVIVTLISAGIMQIKSKKKEVK